jgi:hypothetical protein
MGEFSLLKEIEINLIDFFDPKNIEHMMAFHKFQQQGHWPEEFWAQIKDMTIPNSWHYMLSQKILAKRFETGG